MSLKVYLTTKQLAELANIQPESARRALCVKGSYFGIKPKKLPNGRLGWPREEAKRVLGLGQ